ncbi:MAG: hypothetical protein U5L45_08640 [Saprospiraceae bacterium]|nr:hypothetical protein [Saprospiraceae bacterium]
MPEKRTTSLPSRERSERENQQFRFYVWFQNHSIHVLFDKTHREV